MARLIALLLSIVAAGPEAWAAGQAVFLDTSGSMLAYHADGTVAKLTQPLVQVLANKGGLRVYGFSDQVHSYPTLAAVTPAIVGGYTNLGKVVDQAIQDKLGLFWIITDNLEQSPGSAEGAGTEQFYMKLRDDAVNRVTVFPVMVGPGKPGLIVYAILLNPDDAASYDQVIAGFRTSASRVLSTDALLMKPLDRGTISTTVTPAVQGRSGGKDYYETGKPIQKVIEVKFQSSLRHLAIKDSIVGVQRREPKFQDDSLLRADSQTIQIRPNQIDVLPGGGETAQKYEIVLQLSELRLKPGIGTLWKAAFGKNSEEARLNTTLIIKVPGRNFRLHDDFLSKFHASTPQEARATGKIFALDSLPALMSPDVTAVEVSQETVFVVKYPFYPTLIWLAAALGLVSLLLLLVKFLPGWLPSRRSKWKVSVEGESGTPAIVRKNRLLVDGIDMGGVQDDVFTPGPEVELAGGAPSSPLEHETIVPMRVRRRPMSVKFEERGRSEAKPAPEPDRSYKRR